MHITYKIVCIAVKTVIVIIPALVGTEFLIGAAANNFAAIETFLFHSTKVLIKIQKTVYKRLSTTNFLCYLIYQPEIRIGSCRIPWGPFTLVGN